MIKHYLTLAWRNLRRQKTYSFLNIFGLAVGLACFMIIMLWVRHELGYDKFNENYENLYRVGIDIRINDTEGMGTTTTGLMAARLVEDYPEVVNAARIYKGINKLVSYIDGDVHHTENRVYYADSTIFDLFTIPVVKGDPAEKLNRPLTMFITESTALKYFGSEDPIGKTMSFDGWWDYEVVGIIEDTPSLSHWQYDFIVANHEVGRFHEDAQWLSDNLTTYILLQDGIDYLEFERKLIDFRNRYLEPIALRDIGMGFEEWGETGNKYLFYLDPVKNIYLNPRATQNPGPQGSMVYIIVFIIIAVFILFIACINFINLTTARAATRAKEIGLRKVVGSVRGRIIGQLLIESVLYSLIAMLLAVLILLASLPYFADLTGTNLTPFFLSLENLPILLILPVLVGLFSGIYSALIMSSFKITTVLKGNMMQDRKRTWFRNGLVLLQFAISIFIIICTMIVYYQLKYISNKKLGFEKEQVLVIKRIYSLGEKMITCKEEIAKLADVKAVSIASAIPGSGTNGTIMQRENSSAQEMVHFQQFSGDYDYLDVMGIELKAGRFYSEEFTADTLACVINESAVRNLDLKDPVGARIWYSGSEYYRIVIGVVNDFHVNSLKHEIPNVMLMPPYSHYSHYLLVKLKTGNIGHTLDQLRSVWNQFAVNQPFQYFFLDEHFENLHQTEKRSGNILTIFSILAVFIACLGLYGLAAFTAQQKTREIGIRKVLGASATTIMTLLLRQFTRWVLLANLIAWPLAWLAMRKWLQNYAYAVDIRIWVFLTAGLLTLSIAVITVVYQSIRAASGNPVTALKYE